MKQYEANLASQSKVTDQHEEAFSLENFSDSEDKVNKMQDSKAKNKPRLKKESLCLLAPQVQRAGRWC
jgi:hypothetical protein